ncbi:DUF4129 domain-containing protein [Bacillus sp. RO3]|nr:DUF4129 domain-containing protein [Bacillus sp. RO3]
MLNENKARDQIKEIMDSKEYQEYDRESQGPLASWWEKAKEWLSKQLEALFPSFEPTGGAASGILITLVVIAVAILLIVAFYSIRGSVRKRRFRMNKPLQSMNELEWSYDRHFEEAQNQEELDDYSKATRHIFLALLLYFHEKEYLEARVWKTNWEYYDELRKVNQEWADRFYKLALLFDEVAYGERTVDEEEYLPYKQEALGWLDDRTGS